MIGHWYSFWAEVTFPIGQSISAGMLQVIASIVGTVITLAVNFGIEQYGGYSTFIILGASWVIGILSAIFTTEKLNKSHQQLRMSVSSLGSVILLPVKDNKVSIFILNKRKDCNAWYTVIHIMLFILNDHCLLNFERD